MPNRPTTETDTVDLATKSTTKEGFAEFSKHAREAEIALWSNEDWKLATKPFSEWTNDEINKVMSGYITKNLANITDAIKKFQQLHAMIEQLAEHYPKTQVSPKDFKEFQFFLRAVSQEGGCSIHG